MEQLITELVHGIDQEDIRVLLRNVSLALVAYGTHIILFAVTYIVRQIPTIKSPIDVLSTVHYAACVSTVNWVPTTSVFYWIVLQLLVTYHKQQMLWLVLNLANKKIDYEVVRSTCRRVRESCESFENNLSFLPFYWFLFGMVASTQSVYDLIRDPSNILSLSYTLFDYLPPILVVLAASHASEESIAMVNRVIDCVASSKALELANKFLMLRELESIRQLRQTGMSFFLLDRSFLVSYVGSVLTFAALIAGFTRNWTITAI